MGTQAGEPPLWLRLLVYLGFAAAIWLWARLLVLVAVALFG